MTPKSGATYEDLQLQLKEAKIQGQRDTARINDEIKYGTRSDSGTDRVGGTVQGQMEIDAEARRKQESEDSSALTGEQIRSSKATTTFTELADITVSGGELLAYIDKEPLKEKTHVPYFSHRPFNRIHRIC